MGSGGGRGDQLRYLIKYLQSFVRQYVVSTLPARDISINAVRFPLVLAIKALVARGFIVSVLGVFGIRSVGSGGGRGDQLRYLIKYLQSFVRQYVVSTLPARDISINAVRFPLVLAIKALVARGFIVSVLGVFGIRSVIRPHFLIASPTRYPVANISGFPRVAARALVCTNVIRVIGLFRIRSVIWPHFCFALSTRDPAINTV